MVIAYLSAQKQILRFQSSPVQSSPVHGPDQSPESRFYRDPNNSTCSTATPSQTKAAAVTALYIGIDITSCRQQEKVRMILDKALIVLAFLCLGGILAANGQTQGR